MVTLVLVKILAPKVALEARSVGEAVKAHAASTGTVEEGRVVTLMTQVAGQAAQMVERLRR